jgi:hypothetical protein
VTGLGYSSLGILVAAFCSRAVAAQTFELVPEVRAARIGDPVAFRATVRLAPGQSLIDEAPRPLLPPGDGVLLISADTLRTARDGALTGLVRLAFYRTGLQPAPTLALLYHRSAGEPAETLLHQPAAVEIVPVLPPGNPALKDIKGLIALGGRSLGPLLLIVAALGLVGYWFKRRRHPGPTATEPPPMESTGKATPFEEGLARLGVIAGEGWPERGEVERYYAAVAEVVRQCLEEGGALPTAACTTSEILAALPTRLALDGQRARCGRVLGAADLVKFARLRPNVADAHRHLQDARTLLAEWRQAVRAGEPRDAVR